jgi:hypothetical protein
MREWFVQFEGSISHNMNYNIFLKAHDRENKSLHREQLTVSDVNSLTFTTPTIQKKTLGKLIPVTAKKKKHQTLDGHELLTSVSL